MNSYRNLKLVLVAMLETVFLVILYNISLNGRYVLHPNKGVMIYSRTGDIYKMTDKSKIN